MPSQRQLLTLLLSLAIIATIVSVPVVEKRALDAENAYISDQLEGEECLTDWGVNEGAGPTKDASITGFTGTGVRVDVTMPYAYTTEDEQEPIFADTASEAVYEVNLTNTRRLGGDTISPC